MVPIDNKYDDVAPEDKEEKLPDVENSDPLPEAPDQVEDLKASGAPEETAYSKELNVSGEDSPAEPIEDASLLENVPHLEDAPSEPASDELQQDDDDVLETSDLVTDEDIDYDAILVAYFSGSSPDDLQTAIETLVEEHGGEAAYARVQENNPRSKEATLIGELRFSSQEAADAQRRILALQKAGRKLSRVMLNGEGKIVLGPFNPPPPQKGRELTGKAGIVAVKRAITGVKHVRIPLLNSGFYVELTPPVLSATSSMQSKFQSVTEGFGSDYGALMYTFADMFHRVTMMEIIKSHISNATISGWSMSNRHTPNLIRIEDLDVLATSLAGLMFPNGFRGFRHACLNPKCKHVFEPVVDLTKLVQYDYGALSKKAVEHMRNAARGTVSVSDIEEYQKEVWASDGLEEDPGYFRFDRYGFIFGSPSFDSYKRSADRFIDELRDAVDTGSPEALYNKANAQLLRQFSPWVKKVTIYADKDSDEVDGFAKDEEVIEALLESIQTNEDDINPIFNAIWHETSRRKLSHIGHPVEACPACGHIPETKSGFFTVDPIETFFTAVTRKNLSLG